MSEQDNFALVPKPPGEVEEARPGAKRILFGMMEEALELAQKKPVSLVPQKFRIGDYEWCKPDYDQIVLWAEQLTLSPDDVIELLRDGEEPSGVKWAKTVFEGGRIKKLNLDISHFFGELAFVDGLQITHLSFHSGEYAYVLENPQECPRMEDLPHSKLTHADLPLLTHFSCWESPFFDPFLCNLCLSVPFNPAIFAPNLEVLECHGYIDVRSLPYLKELICDAKILQRPDQHFKTVKT